MPDAMKFLAGHMALLMVYYNFLRPHSALKFGTTLRTPAIQAGLADRRLSFRDVFTSREALFLVVVILVLFKGRLAADHSQYGSGGATPQQQLPEGAPLEKLLGSQVEEESRVS
jgi:hypothetical protein